MESVTEDNVSVTYSGDLFTIYISGIQYFQGTNRKQANLLLDTIYASANTTGASFLLKFNGEDNTIAYADSQALGRALSIILNR